MKLVAPIFSACSVSVRRLLQKPWGLPSESVCTDMELNGRMSPSTWEVPAGAASPPGCNRLAAPVAEVVTNADLGNPIGGVAVGPVAQVQERDLIAVRPAVPVQRHADMSAGVGDTILDAAGGHLRLWVQVRGDAQPLCSWTPRCSRCGFEYIHHHLGLHDHGIVHLVRCTVLTHA